jgi:hypothetical protein
VTQRDGRKWTRQEQLDDVRQRFDLPRASVAECVLRLTDAGFDENHAAELMLRAYEDAIQRQAAYTEPWVQHAAELVRARQDEQP